MPPGRRNSGKRDTIVYDRYHMQAQFGKDVLGAVRLEETRKHNAMAKQLEEDGCPKKEIKEEKRLDGLIAHASHPISTSKLEGFNNRIKVAKRVAYGYRDEDYFFSLIQFISIPSVRFQSLKKT